MLGRLALVILAVLWIAAAAEAPAESAVDLDAPGALESLRRSNPAHYDKVQRIVRGVLEQPDARVPRWMEASFDGRDVSYRPIVMTSYPAKRRLSFSLDATRYEVIVLLTNMRGEIVPAR